MFNAQVEIYRLQNDGIATSYNTNAYATCRAIIEPAGLTPVAPIDANIGTPYNVHLNSPTRLEIKEGDKLVNTLDNNQSYVIISSINEYVLAGSFHYEFVTYQPK